MADYYNKWANNEWAEGGKWANAAEYIGGKYGNKWRINTTKWQDSNVPTRIDSNSVQSVTLQEAFRPEYERKILNPIRNRVIDNGEPISHELITQYVNIRLWGSESYEGQLAVVWGVSSQYANYYEVQTWSPGTGFGVYTDTYQRTVSADPLVPDPDTNETATYGFEILTIDEPKYEMIDDERTMVDPGLYFMFTVGIVKIPLN